MMVGFSTDEHLCMLVFRVVYLL